MITLGKSVCVVELDGSRLCAVSAVLSKEAVEVRRWLSAVRPETVSLDQPEALGEWVAGELARAGISRGPTVLAVSRGDVVLKRLSFPGSGVSESELGGMVRLQMGRQLTMPIEAVTIDYAPLADGPDGSRHVLAGAMPTDRVAFGRQLVTSAGLRLGRIGLRCSGVAALLGPMSQTRAGTVVGVAVGWGSTELVVVEDGQMVFARAVDAPRPTSRAEVESFAERVAVEIKRTWMSYRAGKPGPSPDAAVVLGSGDLVRRVGERCGELLGTGWQVLGLPGTIRVPAEMPDSERSAAAPLLGLLLETVLGRETLDFASPRRAPDRAAQMRVRVLGGAAACMAVAMGGFMMSKVRIDAVESRIRDLENQRKELATEYEAFLVEHAKLGHIQQWQNAGADWLGHINVITGQVPQGGVALAEDLSGRLSAPVAFVPRGAKPGSTSGRYPDGEWTTSPTAVFDFRGRSMGRGIATQMRGRFLSGEVYTVETVGPDVTERFSLQLKTTRTKLEAAPAGGASSGTKSGGKPEGKKPAETKPEGTKPEGVKPESPPAPPTDGSSSSGKEGNP